MRGWLAVRLAGLAVEDVVVPLEGGQTQALIGLTPTGLVPALEHDGRMIWDSLAICEYCAEAAPLLWPSDKGMRATARSVAAEMHSGFRDLRIAMPMNLGRSAPGHPAPEAALRDIARIDAVWQHCLDLGGPFLFGETFTIPDVMYAPVVARFLTYGPRLSDAALEYCAAVREFALVDQWYALAAAEPEAWRLAKYE
jgi:glutathione S-transferase